MTLGKIFETADEIARKAGVSPSIVKALIMTESAGKIEAETPYARGLMGVSQAAVSDVNRKLKTKITYAQMFDPALNIFAGANYLRIIEDYWRRYLTEYAGKDPRATAFLLQVLSVMSYNWGIGNVRNWLEKTKMDNSKIDESVPDETKAHFCDVVGWTDFFLKGKEG